MIDEWLENYNIRLRAEKHFDEFIKNFSDEDKVENLDIINNLDYINLEIEYTEMNIFYTFGTENISEYTVEVCLLGKKDLKALFKYIVIFNKNGKVIDDIFLKEFTN